MPTKREEIASYLEAAERTPKELAAIMKMTLRDTLDNLEHVRRSVGRKFVVRQAKCTKCDFEFDSRRKLSTPSRCPECKSERIVGPWLSIKD